MAKGKNVLLILGSGLHDLYKEHLRETVAVETKHGIASFHKASIAGNTVYIVFRHGKEHLVPPHLVNYKLNILAAKKLDIDYIIATSAVGSLNEQIKTGSYVVVDQFLDFTKTRPFTIFETKDEVTHTDMSKPYSDKVRAALVSGLKAASAEEFHTKGTYACVEGPRYETPAEIRMYKAMGADLVGMTTVPEVIFSNEVGIQYGTLAIVTNMAAGLQEKISHDDIVKEANRITKMTTEIIDKAVEHLLK